MSLLTELAKKYGWKTQRLYCYQSPIIRIVISKTNYIEEAADDHIGVFYCIDNVNGLYNAKPSTEFILSCARALGLPTSFHDVAEVANGKESK